MNHPAKEYNYMTGKMEDTSLPQWQEYYKEKEEFDAFMEAKKPLRENYSSEVEYRSAYYQWDMARSCDAPNKPGYWRANND